MQLTTLKSNIKNLKDKIRKRLKLVNPNSKNKPAIPSNIGSYFHVDTGILKNKLTTNYFDYALGTDDERIMRLLTINDEINDDTHNIVYTYPKDMIEYNTDQESKNDELIADVAFEMWKDEEKKRLNKLIKLRKKRLNDKKKKRKSRKKSRKKSGRNNRSQKKKTMKKSITPSLSRQSSSGISDYINSDGTFSELPLSKYVEKARDEVPVYFPESMKGRSKKKKSKKKKSKKMKSKKKKTKKK